jgi:hypothetical protein
MNENEQDTIIYKRVPHHNLNEIYTSQALYVFLMKHYELFLDPAIRGGQGMLV